MASFYSYEALFGVRHDLVYSNRTSEQIIRNRQTLENQLFFDRMLQALGLAKGMKNNKLEQKKLPRFQGVDGYPVYRAIFGIPLVRKFCDLKSSLGYWGGKMFELSWQQNMVFCTALSLYFTSVLDMGPRQYAERQLTPVFDSLEAVPTSLQPWPERPSW